MLEEIIKILAENIWGIVYPLSIIGLGAFFNSRFKMEGKIVAEHVKKELLADIAKSVSDAKNSSEFEYHKRKEDSEKLERFYLIINEAFHDDEKNGDNLMNGYIKIHAEISRRLDNEKLKGIDVIDLVNKYYPPENRLKNFKLHEAEIIFYLYLKEYKNSKFNDFFDIWSTNSNEFNKKNHNNSISIIQRIIETSRANAMNKNAILKRDIINMETELKDIFKEIESSNVILKLELGNSFSNLLNEMSSISKNIRKTKN